MVALQATPEVSGAKKLIRLDVSSRNTESHPVPPSYLTLAIFDILEV